MVPVRHLKQIMVEMKAFWLPCHNSIVGGKQGHGPCETFSLQHIIFLCQSGFIEITMLSQRLGKSGHAQFWIYYQT